MPLAKLPAATALKNLKSRTSVWPSRGKFNRKGCLPLAAVRPSFQFGERDRFFCMGSCFAARIGETLAHHGFDVATNEPNPLQEGAWAGSNHLIRYNICSILNEFKWALGVNALEADTLFVAESEGRFMDPYGHYHVHPHPLDHLRKLRQFTASVTRRLTECRVVLLTLGLIEVWFDEKTQLYTNVQPSRLALQQEPDRFSLHVLDFDDIARSLEEIHSLLARFGHPDVRMLVTTSPVPLHATYTEQDVFVANMHSKSAQRAAVGEFVARHANVDYFPSYETVVLGNADMTWQDDQRHVTDITVQLIMEHVLRAYAPQRTIPTTAIETIRKLDEQLNGLNAHFLWDKVSELSVQLEKQRGELTRLTEENHRLKQPTALAVR